MLEPIATLATKDLARVEKKIASILTAIEDGMHHPSMKEKMAALEQEKAELRAILADRPEPPALRLHQHMSYLYREKITSLAEALNQPQLNQQPTELLRGLISKVRMVSDRAAPGFHQIELVGELAGILALSEGAGAVSRGCGPDMTKPPRMHGLKSETMVAGIGFEHCFGMSKTIIPP